MAECTTVALGHGSRLPEFIIGPAEGQAVGSHLTMRSEASMTAHLNVVTIGVTDFARSVKFYSDLGFQRRMKATGDEIAFFDAGGLILSLFRWDMLAEDAQLPAQPRPQAFRGITLAQMCRTDAEVDAAMAKALAAGATLLKAA